MDLREGRIESAGRPGRARRPSSPSSAAGPKPARRRRPTCRSPRFGYGGGEPARRAGTWSIARPRPPPVRPTACCSAWIALMRGRVLLLTAQPLEAVDALRGIRSLVETPPTHVASRRRCGRPTRGSRSGEPERSRSALDAPEADGVPDISLARARLDLAAGGARRAPCASSTLPARRAGAVHALRRLPGARDRGARARRAQRRAWRPARPRALPRPGRAARPGRRAARLRASLRSLLRRAIAHGTSHRSLADELLAELDGESASEGARSSRCSSRSASASSPSCASCRRCSRTPRSRPRCSSRRTR